MADFIQAATQQLDPVYNQQIQQVQSQIPQLEQYFGNLTQGLQAQNQQQVNSGVTQINEDASRRGVLRSTLPNDARQSLTAQLGAALQQSLGQIGLQQTQQIGQLNNQIADIGVNRLKSIQDLAGALQSRDLQERQFQLQKEQAEREYQMKLQAQRQAAASGGGGGVAATKANLQSSLQQDIANAFKAQGANAKYYTERTVLPALYQYYGSLGNDAINKAVYQYRKNALGF
jgi:hypothetical protein